MDDNKHYPTLLVLSGMLAIGTALYSAITKSANPLLVPFSLAMLTAFLTMLFIPLIQLRRPADTHSTT